MNRKPTPIALPGAVVAITGGARGIGLETAKLFEAAGSVVVVGDIDLAAAEAAAASIGANAHALHLDVTDRDSFAGFLAAAEREVGPIDILVNNAGIMPAGSFLEEPDHLVDMQIDINFRGPIIGMKLALPGMIERGRGHIVNVASMSGKFPVPGLAVYSGTKHAVVGISAALRDEIDGSGVSISTVMPNAVRTELTSGLPTERIGLLESDDVAKAIVKSVANRREEIAIPRWFGIWPAFPVLLPTRLIAWFRRVIGTQRLLDDTRIDPAARGDYNERMAKSRSDSESDERSA